MVWVYHCRSRATVPQGVLSTVSQELQGTEDFSDEENNPEASSQGHILNRERKSLAKIARIA